MSNVNPIYRNKNFIKRDYDCTNKVACEILTNDAKVPANYIPADPSILDKLTSLYVVDNVRYWGYL